MVLSLRLDRKRFSVVEILSRAIDDKPKLVYKGLTGSSSYSWLELSVIMGADALKADEGG